MYINISYCVGEIIYFKRTPECIGWTTKLQPKHSNNQSPKYYP